jgi:hypothetical protein
MSHTRQVIYLDDGEMEQEQPRYIKFYGSNFAKDESVNGLSWSTGRKLIAYTGTALTEATAAAVNITCGGESCCPPRPLALRAHLDFLSAPLPQTRPTPSRRLALAPRTRA